MFPSFELWLGDHRIHKEARTREAV